MSARWSPITRWGTRSSRCRCPGPTRCTRSRSSRAVSARSATRSSGRPAETIIFGELSTGASDDLAKVTDIARSIVTRYGMSEELGLVSYEKNQRSFLGDTPGAPPYTERSYSEATAREIDDTVKSIVDQAFRRTVNLLRAQREVLERGARLLLEHETLDEADLLALRQPEPVAGPAEGG